MPDFALAPQSIQLRLKYLENIKQASSALAILFKWNFKDIENSTMSDIKILFESDEFKSHQKNENEKFNILIKAITRSGG